MRMGERLAGFLLVLAVIALPQHAAAQAGPAPQPGTDAPHEAAIAPIPVAPVVIDGATLFRVRGVSSYPAEARAADIVGRILAVARDESIAPESIRVEERPLGSAILAGDRHLVTLVEADARVEDTGRRVLADSYARAISRAIARYRADRDPEALASAAGLAAGALALVAAVLLGLRRLHRRVDALLDGRYRERVADLQIKGFRVLHAEHMWGGMRRFVGALHVLAAIACAYVGLHFALARFPMTRGAAASLLEVVVSPLAKMGAGLMSAIPDLVFLAILALITRYILKTLRLFFDAVEHGSVTLSGFDAEWSGPTYRIVRLLVIAFALVVAYPYIPGSQSDAFKGVSLFIGVIFSLGSSAFVANIIAGYAITYRRAFRVGDRIRVGDVFGDVTEIRLQVTHVRTPKNEEVVIPNSTIVGSHVTNYSTLAKSRGLILHTTVGIGYETPWRQVEAMLLMAAERTGDIMREPPPYVLQKSLGDFAITYELNAYCDKPLEMSRIYTELHRNILDVFNEYGVAIMTPAYEGDPEQPKVVPRDQWYAAPARPTAPARIGE